MWDVNTGELLQELEGHNGAVKSERFKLLDRAWQEDRTPSCGTAESRHYDSALQGASRERAERGEQGHRNIGEQGGQLGVGNRDETLGGGNDGWRGYRGGRDDQAIAKLRQAVGHLRDNAGSWG